MLDRLPSRLLRLEGLAVLVAALVVYFDAGFGWLLLVVLLLAPDVSFLGFLGGPAVGAACYDAAHTTVLPLALGVVGILGDSDTAAQLALIWLAHIGGDRFLGYGLRYPIGLNGTHLQRV